MGRNKVIRDMTKCEKHWTEMKEYCIEKAKFYRKHNDCVNVRLYEKLARDASYMIDHEDEYSDELRN